MLTALLDRIRPTVLFLHLWMGFVIAVCCTYFGPGTESIGLIGSYVSSILLTAADLVKDNSGTRPPFRMTAAALAVLGGCILIYFVTRWGGPNAGEFIPETGLYVPHNAPELVAAVHSAMLANLATIKYLVGSGD